MTPANSVEELKAAVSKTVKIEKGKVSVVNWEAFRQDALDKLAWTSAFSSSDEAKALAAWIVQSIARMAGNGPASINDIYMAIGKGQLPQNFTVPAINVRAISYYFARSIFKAAKRHEVGAVIFEIARSEMGYTNQPPREYTTSILAGALKESYPWPVYIQGDHFQINAKNFAKNPDAEVEGLKKLIQQAVEAQFYNIDLDTSTLVDLTKTSLEEQQYQNSLQAATLTQYIRKVQPDGVTVSVGGEIGEVGGKNSTAEELSAYMGEYQRFLGGGLTGLSKVSVQTGTSHGGVVLPDGTMAKVKVDFDTLGKLSSIIRSKYGMGGAVQHGASTLPVELFDKFPQVGTCEIHLATEFQNILFEHPQFPADMKQEIYAYLLKEAKEERKEGETDQQFFYKTRKKAVGAFKRAMWSLPDGVMASVMTSLEDKVDLLIRKLNVSGTGPLIKGHARIPSGDVPMPREVGAKAQHFEGDD